jgi:hypothetical protein
MGVTAFDAADDAETPAALIAVTVNVYEVPLVSPVTVADVAVAAALAVVSLDAVTVYPVIADPPFEAGAFQVTVACPLPAVAVTPVGAPATVAGVTAFDGAETGPDPPTVAAVTVNV